MPVISLEVKKTVGTFSAAGQSGAATEVLGMLPYKTVHFAGMQTGTFSTCSLQLQGSNDNTNWVNLGDAVTLNGMYAFTTVCAFIRILTNSHTSGVPTAVLAGQRQA